MLLWDLFRGCRLPASNATFSVVLVSRGFGIGPRTDGDVNVGSTGLLFLS